MTRPAVFLDRDGTIIEDVGFLRDVAQIDLLPWSAEAIRQLNGAGFAVIVITNQSGVGRGYYDCPHHPESIDARYGIECDCRKPGSGLLRRAAADFDIDLTRSWMVGDWWRDVQAGIGAGTRTILIRSGRSDVHRPAPEGAPQ